MKTIRVIAIAFFVFLASSLYFYNFSFAYGEVNPNKTVGIFSGPTAGFIVNDSTAFFASDETTFLPCGINSNGLGFGSTGRDVEKLQIFLEIKGFLEIPDYVSRGYFGPLTQNAVKRYQESFGLPITGYFGSITNDAVQRNCN